MDETKEIYGLFQRIKDLCISANISVSKLERDCGFSNSYITNLRTGKMPADRLQKIADYFNVSTKFLLTGEKDEEYYSPEAKEIMQDIHDREDLRALFHVAKKSSPEYVALSASFWRRWLRRSPNNWTPCAVCSLYPKGYESRKKANIIPPRE